MTAVAGGSMLAELASLMIGTSGLGGTLGVALSTFEVLGGVISSVSSTGDKIALLGISSKSSTSSVSPEWYGLRLNLAYGCDRHGVSF